MDNKQQARSRKTTEVQQTLGGSPEGIMVASLEEEVPLMKRWAPVNRQDLQGKEELSLQLRMQKSRGHILPKLREGQGNILCHPVGVYSDSLREMESAGKSPRSLKEGRPQLHSLSPDQPTGSASAIGFLFSQYWKAWRGGRGEGGKTSPSC